MLRQFCGLLFGGRDVTEAGFHKALQDQEQFGCSQLAGPVGESARTTRRGIPAGGVACRLPLIQGCRGFWRNRPLLATNSSADASGRGPQHDRRTSLT